MNSAESSVLVAAITEGENSAKEKAVATRALASFMGEGMSHNQTDNSKKIELPVRHTTTMSDSSQQWYKLCAKRTRNT